MKLKLYFLSIYFLFIIGIVSAAVVCDSFVASSTCNGNILAGGIMNTFEECHTACEGSLIATCCSYNDLSKDCHETDGSRILGGELWEFTSLCVPVCLTDLDCNYHEYCSDGWCLDSCDLVATNNTFKVVDSLGREFMRVDTNGDIAFSSLLYTGQSSIVSDANDFLISNVVTGNYNFQLALDLGNFDNIFLRGAIYQNQSSITYTSSQNTIIRNSGGTTILKIDPSGNLYTTGKYGEWCDCEAGTYSPYTISGQRILHYVAWGTDYKYADGYCQIIRGCREATAVATADVALACRCDKSYGCTGESCATASGDWTSFTSITCA